MQALRTAQAIGCDAAQIFVTNPRAWRAPEPQPKREALFRQAAAECDIAPIVVHATYLINLASQRAEIFENSVTLLRATLDLAQRHGATSVVFHIGSHGGAGEAAGIERLAEGIRRTLDGTPESVALLLENDVGGGGKLGYRFENLAATLDLLPEHAARLGVCLDTAHLWGAGFDIGTPAAAAQVLDEADRILGLRRVAVLHVNDTPKALGSHLDNHARIGEGVIPLAGLGAFLRSPLLAHTTALLETPIAQLENGQPDWAADREHMARARALAGLPMPPMTPMTPGAALQTATEQTTVPIPVDASSHC